MSVSKFKIIFSNYEILCLAEISGVMLHLSERRCFSTFLLRPLKLKVTVNDDNLYGGVTIASAAAGPLCKRQAIGRDGVPDCITGPLTAPGMNRHPIATLQLQPPHSHTATSTPSLTRRRQIIWLGTRHRLQQLDGIDLGHKIISGFITPKIVI
jgi:hypothetical protein